MPPHVHEEGRTVRSFSPATVQWGNPLALALNPQGSTGEEPPVPTSSARPAIFYGWVIVATTFLIALVTVGGRSAFGVFVVPMSEEFGWSRSTISLAAALGFLVNGLSQPFVGRLFDTLGGRKVILASLAIFGVTTILLALTFHILFLIVVFGIIMSIAWSGTSLTTTSALLSRWFQRRRATVLSLSTAGASAGGLLLVPLAMAVLQRTDWRITWVVLGAMVLVAAWPLACFLLRDDPTDLGVLPDGDRPSADGHQVNPARAAPGPLETETWRPALRSWPFWQLAGSYCVCGFTTAILTTHFIPYAIDRGMTPSTAATALGVMNGLNVVGVIAMGMLADRCGRKNLLALVYAARGGAYALLLLAPDPWGLWGFAAIAGFSYWATAPLTTSLTADVYGLKTLGTLSGITFLIHQVGGAASIQFAGLMRDMTGSYTLPLTIAGIFLLPAALSAFAIREQQYSPKAPKRPASTTAVDTTAAPV
jgi:MFS family permease